MSEAIKKPINTTPESYNPKKPEILGMAKRVQRESGYPNAFTLPDKSTAMAPETQHNCPAFASGFANEFAYFMDYTGQGYGFINGGDGWRCDVNYTLACVISGHAMRPASLPVTKEGMERLYNAVGYPSRKTFCADPGWTDVRRPYAKNGQLSEAEMKEVIKYALCILGQPVVISPLAQCWYGIIVGYKLDGDVLMAYWYPPYFMAPDNVAPQTVEIDNWFHEDIQLTIMGKRENVVPIEELYKEGFRQTRIYLTAGIHGEDRKYYEEWENFLRLDIKDMITQVEKTGIVPGARLFADDFKGVEMDTEKLREKINTICDPTWCEMAERRYYVMHFFRQAIKHFPKEKDALQTLDAHFWHTSEIMGNLNNGYISEVGHDPVNAEAFKNPEVRARMADCVREFREADAKGLEMIEKLLSRMKI